MMTRLLLRNQRGAAALEFAFAAPVLFLFVVAVAQLGTVFFANTGLQHALSEGARVAAVYPVPSDTIIAATVTDRKFGFDPAKLDSSVQLITHGKDAADRSYIDLRLKYAVPFKLFFKDLSLVLDHSRRVYTQPEVAAATPATSPTTPTTPTSPTPTSPTPTSPTPTTPTTSGGEPSSAGGTTPPATVDDGKDKKDKDKGNGNGSSGNK